MTAFGSAFGCTSICQSTATFVSDRAVIVAFELDKNPPSVASSPTASATPIVTALSRPGRRAMPRSQRRITTRPLPGSDEQWGA